MGLFVTAAKSYAS